jgi:hypothetical protein
MTIEKFQGLEKELETLKKIAELYPRHSSEYLAIEHAALALAFALTGEPERFSVFIRDRGKELSDQQRAYLKSLGLNEEKD